MSESQLDFRSNNIIITCKQTWYQPNEAFNTNVTTKNSFCSLARFQWEIRTSQLMHQARLGFNNITGKHTWDQLKKHSTHTQEVHKLEKNSHTPTTSSQAHMLETNQKKKIHIHLTYTSLLCSLAKFWWKIHTSHQNSTANKLMQLLSLRLTSDSTIPQIKHTWHQPKLAFRTHTHMNYTN